MRLRAELRLLASILTLCSGHKGQDYPALRRREPGSFFIYRRLTRLLKIWEFKYVKVREM